MTGFDIIESEEIFVGSADVLTKDNIGCLYF